MTVSYECSTRLSLSRWSQNTLKTGLKIKTRLGNYAEHKTGSMKKCLVWNKLTGAQNFALSTNLFRPNPLVCLRVSPGPEGGGVFLSVL